MTGGTISINSANATDTNVVQVLPNVTTFSKIVKLPVMATVAIPTCTAALRGSMVMAMAYAVVGTTIRDRILVCRASTSYPTVGTNTYNWAELGND